MPDKPESPLPPELIIRDPAPTRDLEPWELAEYRDYWPDVKKMTTSYRFFNTLTHGMVRIIIVSATVFTAVWGLRDIIGRVLKAIFVP